MRELRESGVDWIGRVPAEWEVRKNKYLFDILKRIAGKEGYDVLSVTQRGLRIKDIESGEGQLADDYSGYQFVFPGDFVMNHMDLLTGWVDCSELFGVTSPDYRVFRPKRGIEIDSRFYRYVFQYCYLNKVFYNLGNGVADKGRWRLQASAFKNFLTPFPPFSEQQRIADHLDEQCDTIDEVGKALEDEIDSLRRLRKATIFRIATKGLDNAAMRDSGIDWIGPIPETWGVGRIGGLYQQRNEKVSDEDFLPLSVTKKGVIPQLETAAKTNNHDNRKLVKAGDFVINSRSDRRGSCGISLCDGSVSLINTVLEPRELMSPSYYGYLFHTAEFADEFYKWGHGIVDDLWTTRWQDMKSMKVPLPPLEEQQRIADYLDKRCAAIDSAVDARTKQLERLEDYRKALIYAYVTGKKEVPVS